MIRRHSAVRIISRWILPVAALCIAAFVIGFSAKLPFISTVRERVVGTVAFLFLGQAPHFYHLDMEKNGQDLRLWPGDALELSYRDEFVIKAISSDDILGRGIIVDVEGVGSDNDGGVLLKGIQLIDNIVLQERGTTGAGAGRKYNILVKYRGEKIAALPVKVIILPQDWLRYARSTDNSALQIEYLKRAIITSNGDVNIIKMLAGVYRRAGLSEEAIVQYRRVLELAPEDIKAWTELTQCYMKTANYGQVIETSRQLLRLKPGDPEHLLNIALAYSALAQWSKAIANYEASLKLQPGNPLANFKLGEAYEKVGRLAEAISHYKEVIARAPDALHAVVALAGAHYRTGNYDEAIKWYRKAAGKQPQSAFLWANLGLAYGGKGLWQEEVGSYRKALALSPNDAIVHFNLAAAYEKRKKERESLAEYQKVLSLKPGDLAALQRIAAMDMNAGRYAEAIKKNEIIVRILPKSAVHYVNLGLAYAELGKYRQAAENYEKAIEHGIKEPQVRYNLAYAYERSGRTKESILEYEKYALVNPTEQVLNLLAAYYLKEKQYDNALKSYRKLGEVSKKKANFYSGIAHVYNLKGDIDNEIEYLKQAIRHDPEDDAAYQDLAAAYESKEMYAEAYRACVKAYELNPESKNARAKIPQLRIRMLEKKMSK